MRSQYQDLPSTVVTAGVASPMYGVVGPGDQQDPDDPATEPMGSATDAQA